MSVLRRILTVLSICGAVWAAGGLMFVAHVTHLSPPSTPINNQAIIVLTGESNRVNSGIQLLSDGRADTLFISGVDPSVTKSDLQRLHSISDDRLDQITLGYQAKDTQGNAREAADWMTTHDITDIRLVTSNYHLPRAKWWLSKYISNADITGHPTTPAWMASDDWRADANNWAKLFREYIKFTLAVIGVHT